MYRHCIFCQRDLGTNEVLEAFPIGRRLAFDAGKGRLWVVCRRCERWNLSPLEERWEAIEQAERLFETTQLRVSTEHIGLARHREGLDLVRIGRPLRPEFAAWRYGDQFGRRRRRAILMGAGTAGVIGAAAVGAGLIAGMFSVQVLLNSGSFVNLWVNGRTVVRVPVGDGEILKLKQSQLGAFCISADGEHGWAVQLLAPSGLRVSRRFTGPEAERIAALLLPRINSSGASRRVVQESIREIERAGGSDRYVGELHRRARLSRGLIHRRLKHGIPLNGLPLPQRLAFEMALHEEQERFALEGELKALEIAWKAAEEVAGIADDLLVPEPVRAKLTRG